MSDAAARQPDCEATVPGGPVFITEICDDPVLNRPYVDARERVTTTDPATGVTVRSTYVHGGFEGTGARFAFYFPDADSYRGRFFQSTYPTVSQEEASPGTIAFAVSNGAYVVSSNNAGGVPAGGELAPYRANAAAAKYSRTVAEQLYGTTDRPRGYIYGASGGAYQTLGALENTSGTWDGGVPMVPGVPNAIPSFQAVGLLALRVLGDRLHEIADAMAPGGSGDPYAGLTDAQQEVLREVTRLGFPLRGWWQHATLDGGSYFTVQIPVRLIDPVYVDDFWSAPGYEGRDGALAAERIRHATTVTDVGPGGLVLSDVPAGDLRGADVVVTTGAASGQTLSVVGVSGNAVKVDANPGVGVGDDVTLDNSWSLALQHYQRHQVPGPDLSGWNQYRDAGGGPRFPQRPVLVGPILAASTAGAVNTGRFHGKMIMLASTMDVEAYPWSADWYRRQAQAALGPDLDHHFRLWFMDNADHHPDGPAAMRNAAADHHVVSYSGELQQALLDLDAWVVAGAEPPAGTGYLIDADNQVHLPATAARRAGVQPVVALSAETEDAEAGGRLEIPAGTTVTLRIDAEVPPGAGTITAVEWDPQGTGDYVAASDADTGPHVTQHLDHTFATAGTYFPAVRVTSQRDGGAGTPYGRVQNLARVRVVVSPA